MMRQKKTVDIITLGCSKNLVDSEKLMRQLELGGYRVTHDAEEPRGEIAIVNTCGFIGDAKEESINMILQMGQRKAQGTLERLYVMGCLSERYLHDLEAEIPEVDRFFGKFDYNGILDELGISYRREAAHERVLTTPPHYAYVKISEGCDRHCAYCAIPIITGRHVSRPMEEILDEVKQLVAQGVREFQVIAQELTYYGLDLYRERRIAQLIEQMAAIPGVEWIRLHYAYPTDFPMELLPVMREHENVCKYLDIALQHISDSQLDAMHRHITSQETYHLIETLRREVPGIHLRTTLMVGFPGETDEDFSQLLDFVRWARFDRMGAFAYSHEDGTYAALHYEDNVPEEVKQSRLDRLMAVQQEISEQLAAKEVGKTVRVMVDRKEGDFYVGRTESSSPEVDPEVLIPAGDKTLDIGAFCQVHITASDEFDLYGKAI